MANTRVKIKVTDLIAKLKSERAKMALAHQKAITKFDQDVTSSAAKIRLSLNRLKALNDKALVAEITARYSGEGMVSVGKIGVTSMPILSTAGIDKQIRVLELSSDETITISDKDDYAHYL